MNTDSFKLYIKTEDSYEDIAKDVATRIDTSKYDFEKRLPKVINKRSSGLMKDELDGNVMIKFAASKPKT